MGVNKRTLHKTRRKTRDLDQIHADIHSRPSHLAQHLASRAPEDLPAAGAHYCVECARWFDAAATLAGHRRCKPHKNRVRDLRNTPYSQREAEAAAGIGVYREPIQLRGASAAKAAKAAKAAVAEDAKLANAVAEMLVMPSLAEEKEQKDEKQG